MSRTSSPRDRRSSFTGGLTLPSDHQPDLALLAARGGKALKQFEATQANPQVQMQVARSLPTAASGRTMAALAADTASASEDERTSAAVSTLVVTFTIGSGFLAMLQATWQPHLLLQLLP